ncbi:MAG TPA: hypothetical protein VD971_03380 [Phycisphaerales bacterium]|nr:hypothetical protein [Phycisphaerales bacterium]
MRRAAAIIALCVGAAVFYGVVHDQITARICIEYFTIGHRRAFESDSPTLNALYWGVVATWWAGLIAGVLLATAARAGAWDKLGARQLWPLVAGLLLAMGVSAAAAGVFGHGLADTYFKDKEIKRNGLVVSERERVDYIACVYAHGASYSVGFGGSVVVAIMTVVWRGVRTRRRSTAASPDQSGVA